LELTFKHAGETGLDTDALIRLLETIHLDAIRTQEEAYRKRS
jgi:hypothetical protein